MKSILFSALVVVCAYYLLSQTDSGKALMNNWLPGEQIEQANDKLLANVEQRINQFEQQHSAQQQHQLAQLEHQVAQLNTQLTKLLEQQTSPPDPAIKQLASTPPSQVEALPQRVAQPANDALNLPPDLSRVQGQTVPAEVAATPQQGSVVSLAQRQKQAALQDIAQRMEQVSLQAASGLN